MRQPNNRSQNGSENTDNLIRELAPSSFVFEMARALSSHACRDIVGRFEAPVGGEFLVCHDNQGLTSLAG